ncbi:hypothetical protein FPV67DRAFT_1604454 [Lyophyllum atratum]|nr:hypothetical protein FPV67DRAFT_1604454 [Lyophyllum atratum]
MPTELSLNCLVFRQALKNLVIIDILDTKNVADLRKLIKKETSPHFDNVPANQLDLFKVSIPLSDDDDSLTASFGSLRLDEQILGRPWLKLSQVFGDIHDDHVHVIVKPPDTHRTEPPPGEPLDVKQARDAFLEACGKNPPSSQGKPQQFRKHQKRSDRMIPCDRPYGASATIPVTLLHPVFGRFKDDCETYTPGKEDNALALELQKVMSDIYDDEDQRAKKVREVFGAVGIVLTRTKVGSTKYETDGDTLSGPHRFNLSDFKNEVACSGAEPYFQAGLYYVESTRDHATKVPNSGLPCILVLVFGPYMSFAGAAWTDRPNLQVLSPALPFHTHHSDTTLRTIAARHLGAYKRAVRSLEAYYRDELPSTTASSSLSPPDPRFPYPTRFTSLDDAAECVFEYVSQLDQDKLLFVARLLQGGRGNICIKFARRYSKDAHGFCASIGAAPRLLGFEVIPGGWFMVVMELLGEDYVNYFEYRRRPDFDRELTRPLLDEVKHSLTRLHDAGFVHGDVRNINLMFTKGSEAKFRLVDFDWAGTIGEVRYPMNVHFGDDLWRPDGAYDGELITTEHDLQMMERILDI